MAGTGSTAMTATIVILIVIIVLVTFGEGGAYSCPTNTNCRCTVIERPPASEKSDGALPPTSGRRVMCPNAIPPISNITQFVITSLPKDTVILDLSGSDVSVLEKNSFEGLTMLTKLNLSGNPISRIQAKSFNGLENLERLDLSGMKLSFLNASMFEGMPRLKRLYLLGTTIQTIQPGTFKVLPALAKLDLQTELLVCDCHLQWIATWLKDVSVRLDDSAICGLPSGLRGTPIRTLVKHDLHCDSPLELPVFELTPSSNQIVFVGDKLPFQCRASLVDTSMIMSWQHDGVVVASNRSLGVFVHAQPLPEQLLMTTMVLERLMVAHSGTWKCLVESASGNVSKSVSVVVLADNIGYCSPVVTDTSRGKYSWPKTLAGVVQMLPCVVSSLGHLKAASARYSCDVSAVWTELDVSRCSYVSQMTRDLENISRVVGTNRSCRVDCARNVLSTITESSHAVSNVEDIIFLSRIISDLSKNIRNSEAMAQGLIDMSSIVMDVSSGLLTVAQRQDQACSRIVKAVEEVADQLLMTRQSVDLHSRNIAVRASKIQPYLFSGIDCASWISHNRTVLDCTTNGSPRVHPVPVYDASIAIPTDILTQIRCASAICPQNDTIRIQTVFYRNAQLFPVDDNLSHYQVTSSVIACKFAGARVVNSTSQITVKIASPGSGTGKIPVHWDFSANGDRGAWASSGCAAVGYVAPLVTFKCNHLTNFAVAEGRLPPLTAFEAWLLSCYNTSVITYMGSAVLVVCLISVCVVFIIHRRNIRMSRKMRHAVINLCICLILLCVTYTFGIRLHHLSIPCRVVGIAIHYFSLCGLFWITAITFKMLHHLLKRDTTPPSPEEANGEPPKPKPIIAGYLLGWGVAIIICGISGAINWANYELQEKYCFLSMDAALMTVFVPAGILGFFDLLLFLRIFCLIQRTPSPTPSPATGKTSVDDAEDLQENEMQLLSSNHTTNSGTDTTHGSNHSVSPIGCGHVDEAYCPGSQLCALLSILLLYCSMWMAGAFAVTLPFSSVLPHHDIVFQCLYAVLASALGAFMLVFYCVGRKDVRASCCLNSSMANDWKYVPANGNLSPGCPAEDPLVSEVPAAGENISLTSRSIRSNGIDASKISSIAATPHSVEPSAFTNVVDSSIFYNPHQNGIAKKYWERSKRKRAVQLRKEVIGGSADDDSLELRNCGSHAEAVAEESPKNSDVEVVKLEITGNEQSNGLTRCRNHEVLESHCTQKPPLPILSPLFQQSKETVDSLSSTPKSHQDSLQGCEKSTPQIHTEPSSLPNGNKRSRPPSEVVLNTNRVRNSLHEPTPLDNGFLEQLELRIPQNTSQTLSFAAVSPDGDKLQDLLPNINNVTSLCDEKRLSTAAVSMWGKGDDLNGNKDTSRLATEQSENLNTEDQREKVLLQTENTSSGCENIKRNPDEVDGSSSEQGVLDIWVEQQKTDLKKETSV